jgi:hypothetical protein
MVNLLTEASHVTFATYITTAIEPFVSGIYELAQIPAGLCSVAA